MDFEADKAGAENVSGVAHPEADALFQFKGLAILEAPGQFVDALDDAVGLFLTSDYRNWAKILCSTSISSRWFCNTS